MSISFCRDLFLRFANTLEMFWLSAKFPKIVPVPGGMLCGHFSADGIGNGAPDVKKQSKQFVFVMVTVVWVFI